MVYLKSVENVITLGKLIGLLFLFCLPLLSILFLKTKRNDLARPVLGTIICGSVCIPGAKHGMLELIPQTLFFLERASANTEGGSGYPRLGNSLMIKVIISLLNFFGI